MGRNQLSRLNLHAMDRRFALIHRRCRRFVLVFIARARVIPGTGSGIRLDLIFLL